MIGSGGGKRMPISVNWTSLYRDFPHLKTSTTFYPTSSATPYELKKPKPYNCIAHALEVKDGCYWPQDDAKWFDGIPRDGTLDSITEAFSRQGYALCNDGNLKRGIQKIAIYMGPDGPTHVARQLASGQWTSKIGVNIDARHTLADLRSPLYGKASIFMARTRSKRGISK